MTFRDWLAGELGTRAWVVASRTTAKLREKYELVITPRRWAELNKQFEAEGKRT